MDIVQRIDTNNHAVRLFLNLKEKQLNKYATLSIALNLILNCLFLETRNALNMKYILV